MLDETLLGERAIEQRFQLGGERRAVDRARLFLGDSADGFFLNEFALQRVQRFERVVPRLQRAHLGRDPEQLADEILDMRRQIDQSDRRSACAASVCSRASIQRACSAASVACRCSRKSRPAVPAPRGDTDLQTQNPTSG